MDFISITLVFIPVLISDFKSISNQARFSISHEGVIAKAVTTPKTLTIR